MSSTTIATPPTSQMPKEDPQSTAANSQKCSKHSESCCFLSSLATSSEPLCRECVIEESKNQDDINPSKKYYITKETLKLEFQNKLNLYKIMFKKTMCCPDFVRKANEFEATLQKFFNTQLRKFLMLFLFSNSPSDVLYPVNNEIGEQTFLNFISDFESKKLKLEIFPVEVIGRISKLMDKMLYGYNKLMENIFKTISDFFYDAPKAFSAEKKMNYFSNKELESLIKNFNEKMEGFEEDKDKEKQSIDFKGIDLKQSPSPESKEEKLFKNISCIPEIKDADNKNTPNKEAKSAEKQNPKSPQNDNPSKQNSSELSDPNDYTEVSLSNQSFSKKKDDDSVVDFNSSVFADKKSIFENEEGVEQNKKKISKLISQTNPCSNYYKKKKKFTSKYKYTKPHYYDKKKEKREFKVYNNFISKKCINCGNLYQDLNDDMKSNECLECRKELTMKKTCKKNTNFLPPVIEKTCVECHHTFRCPRKLKTRIKCYDCFIKARNRSSSENKRFYNRGRVQKFKNNNARKNDEFEYEKKRKYKKDSFDVDLSGIESDQKDLKLDDKKDDSFDVDLDDMEDADL